MIRQQKTFLFPVNTGRFNGGELQIVCSKICEALPGKIDTISYRPNVHTPFSQVTLLIELLCDDLWEELSDLAKEQFIEEEEEVEEDTRYYELNEISKGNL